MDPHLEFLVISQVVMGVFVNTTRVTWLEAGDFKRKRLLVKLHNLALAGICDAAYPRWQHIVDRFAFRVFLDIDHRHVKLTLGRGIAS